MAIHEANAKERAVLTMLQTKSINDYRLFLAKKDRVPSANEPLAVTVY